MTNKITDCILFTDSTSKPPKGRFQRLGDWARENKRALAISLLVASVAALCFGLSMIIAMCVFSGWFATSFGLSTFLINCFSFSGTTGAVTGLTATGALVAVAAASTIGGVAGASYTAGTLVGIPPKEEA